MRSKASVESTRPSFPQRSIRVPSLFESRPPATRPTCHQKKHEMDRIGDNIAHGVESFFDNLLGTSASNNNPPPGPHPRPPQPSGLYPGYPGHPASSAASSHYATPNATPNVNMDRTSSSHPANPSGSSSPSVPPAKDGSPPSAAEAAKIEGNTYFGAQRYAEAVKSYSVAIIRNPNNPIYYSNRALAHIRLDEWTHAVDDCERGLDLKDVATEAILLKLYFYKGQALLALEERAEETGAEGPGRLSEAINSLKKAFDLALAQKSTFIEDIAAKHRSAKAQRFERQDRRRRAEVSELHGYLVKLVQRDRDRQLKQLEAVRCDYSDDSTWEEEEAGIKDGCTARLSEIEALFSQANENSKKRYVPDAFLGKISFEVMTDPVISPASGITYDRPEIVSHLQKIGKWDPLTRQPLHEKDLVPNLALKEVIDEFLSLNGWAFDY